MAGAKEIRTKIKSIQGTQKITRAMEMVAASKMRRAQDRMSASRPYAQKIFNVIGHLAQAHPEYRHPYLGTREVRRIGYIIVSSDRGLCGGLNINLFRSVVREMKTWSERGVEIDLCLLGSKGQAFFKRLGGNVVAQASHLGDRPRLEQVVGPVKVMLDAFDEGRLDRVYIAANEFVNTMTQTPSVVQVVPIRAEQIEEEAKGHWDYIYEPDSKEILDALLTRYIESLVYQAMVENIASEMAARMVAMKAATDNAGELIDELQLIYNKARQAAITQELSEIVSGAAAV